MIERQFYILTNKNNHKIYKLVLIAKKLLINYHQQSMRLLSHNLLICNVAKCDSSNYPLRI